MDGSVAQIKTWAWGGGKTLLKDEEPIVVQLASPMDDSILIITSSAELKKVAGWVDQKVNAIGVSAHPD
ncbi:hypothetical protein L0F63_001771 [Massospora cicadina]|nr:hypothetical protein L0F63_001771 [Massospora cicadina]